MIRRKTIKVSVTTTRSVTVARGPDVDPRHVIEIRPSGESPGLPVLRPAALADWVVAPGEIDLPSITPEETDPMEPKR